MVSPSFAKNSCFVVTLIFFIADAHELNSALGSPDACYPHRASVSGTREQRSIVSRFALAVGIPIWH